MYLPYFAIWAKAYVFALVAWCSRWSFLACFLFFLCIPWKSLLRKPAKLDRCCLRTKWVKGVWGQRLTSAPEISLLLGGKGVFFERFSGSCTMRQKADGRVSIPPRSAFWGAFWAPFANAVVSGWRFSGWRVPGWKVYGWKAYGGKVCGWEIYGWSVCGWKVNEWKVCARRVSGWRVSE